MLHYIINLQIVQPTELIKYETWGKCPIAETII